MTKYFHSKICDFVSNDFMYKNYKLVTPFSYINYRNE